VGSSWRGKYPLSLYEYVSVARLELTHLTQVDHPEQIEAQEGYEQERK
jgi:hypothetical protein